MHLYYFRFALGDRMSDVMR